MANQIADLDEQLDEIISSHQNKKLKEKRLLKKKNIKTKIGEKLNFSKYEKLAIKSNQIFLNQILRLFSEEHFADFIIECGPIFKYCHSCIFLARVPNFYNTIKNNFIVKEDYNSLNAHSNPIYNLENLDFNLCETNNKNSCYLHFRLPKNLLQQFDLKNFLKNIYSETNLIEEETNLILTLDEVISNELNLEKNILEVNKIEKMQLEEIENQKKENKIEKYKIEKNVDHKNLKQDILPNMNQEELNKSLKQEPLYINFNQDNQYIIEEDKLLLPKDLINNLENKIENCENKRELINLIEKNLTDDKLYENFHLKENTISDFSETWEEFSSNSEAALKFSDSLEIQNKEIIKKIKKKDLDKKQKNKLKDNVNESLLNEMISIEEKVNKITNEKLKEYKKFNSLKINSEKNLNLTEFKNDSLNDKSKIKKTNSTSLMRSGTFDMQNQAPINEIKLKQKSLDTNNYHSDQEKFEDSLNVELTEKNKNTFYQYFLDENEINKQQKIEEKNNSNSRQNSGLFFIELEENESNQKLEKSFCKTSTFERKKNKQKNSLLSGSNESNLNSSNIDDNNSSIQTDNSFISKTKYKESLYSNISKKPCSQSSESHSNFSLDFNKTDKSNKKSNNSSSNTLKNNSLINSKQDNSNEDINKVLEQKNKISTSLLGEDLLKLFLYQINCDLTIIVSDEKKELKAHKCILMIRSEYFSKIFSEDINCSQIDLSDFSYDSVKYVLNYLYSGNLTFSENSNPENTLKNLNDSSLAELLSLSDLLQLGILKEVLVLEIKIKFCHNFHNPCKGCINGIINCLELSQKCELFSLFNCCVNWLTRNYKKVWITKKFSTLFILSENSNTLTNTKHNKNITNSIRESTLDSLTIDNVIEKILSFQSLLVSLPKVKWSEMIYLFVEKLIEDFCKFIAKNYDLIVSSQSFVNLGLENSWKIEIIETFLYSSIDSIKPDTACKTFDLLENYIIKFDSFNENNSDLLSIKTRNHLNLDNNLNYSRMEFNLKYEKFFKSNKFSEEFKKLVQRLYKETERYLIHNANEVVHCESWNNLSIKSQEFIKSSSLVIFDFSKPLAKKPVLSSSMMRSNHHQKQLVKTNTNLSSKKHLKFNDKKLVNENKKVLDQTRLQSNKEINIDNNNKEDHIYDEVSDYYMKDLKENKISLPEYAKAIKKKSDKIKFCNEKVINKTPTLSSTYDDNYEELLENNYEKIILDKNDYLDLRKVDSESSLASSCLQEAENLELELIKKVQKEKIISKQSNKQDKLAQSKNQNFQQNITNFSINSSPQMRTSLRNKIRQASANSISSSSTCSATSKTKTPRNSANNKKPPFK